MARQLKEICVNMLGHGEMNCSHQPTSRATVVIRHASYYISMQATYQSVFSAPPVLLFHPIIYFRS